MTATAKPPWFDLDITRFEYIYRWAFLLTTEQSQTVNFLVTDTLKELLYDLLNGTNLLIAVLGFQGTGKTAARQYLADNLPSTASLKWTDDHAMTDTLIRLLQKRERTSSSKYDYIPSEELLIRNALLEAAGTSIENLHYVTEAVVASGLRGRKHESLVLFLQSPNKQTKQPVWPYIKKALGPRRLREVKTKYTRDIASEFRNILIDFPDYDRKMRGLRQRDLARFQILWERVSSEDGYYGYYDLPIPNIVVFWQEELWDDLHFLEGKFQIVKLEPLRPEQLANYYIDYFRGTEPFTRESLLYIADLTRGVWRWFKKYIGLCLRELRGGRTEEPITVDAVRELIATDTISHDWSRELATLWPRERGMRRKAVQIIRYLQENRDRAIPQSELAGNFFGGTTGRAATACSRFLDRLEENGYIMRKRVGQSKVVRYVGMR